MRGPYVPTPVGLVRRAGPVARSPARKAPRVSLLDAVSTTLDARPDEPRDAAAAELARRYAAEIDGAAAARARADRVAERVFEEQGSESALYEEVQSLRAKLSERTALLGLGKNLHALLVDLMAVPRARQGKGGEQTPPAAPEGPDAAVFRIVGVG